jgi:MoxR-like ATPase
LDKQVTIDGVTLHLGRPVTDNPEWVGQQPVLLQLVAAWSCFDETDRPLNPRLLGKPGVGKTTLACAAATLLELDVYIMQGTMDTRPEDLIVSPVLAPDGGVRYMASPLVSAMIQGGVLVLDEGNRMSEKAWASLAPLLDHRRYVDSLVAGIKIPAHDEFRFVTTMNEDASTYELPDYIHSRLMPQILIDFPEDEEERAIIQAQVPFAEGEVVDYVMRFLRAAHDADLRYTVRDGINVVRYAMKVLKRKEAPNALAAVRLALELAVGKEDADTFDVF